MSEPDPDVTSHPLRFAYLGTHANWPAHLFQEAHDRRGDDVRWYRRLADLPRRPAPDVVIHGMFEYTSEGPLGACDLAAVVPPTTLLVSLCGDGQESEIMAAVHILKGNCHPRSMLYVPGPTYGTPDPVLGLYECAVTGPEQISIEGDVDRLDGLAEDVEHLADLGEILAGSERIARLLLAASTAPWSTWQDLADVLHYAPGTIRNIHKDLGEELRIAGLRDGDEDWTAPKFATFATAYRLFITSFANGHLGAIDDDL